MSVPICFEKIIGYSRKKDACVDDAWDDDYAESVSGLYIDELPGMPQRFVSALGGNYNIWEKMYNSLENAIGTFKIDVVNSILRFNEPARQRFKGNIGSRTPGGLLSHASTFYGLRMYSDITGGEFILRGLYIMLNTTEALTLDICDEYDLLHSFPINSVAGRPTFNAVGPVTLPLDRNYFFVYSSAGRPYNNKLTCNCGGYRWCFNPVEPCYKYSKDMWTEWAMVGGVSGNDLAMRQGWSISSGAMGLVLQGDFTCDLMKTICNNFTDFRNNDIGWAIANAIWYKTGEYLSVYVMDSEEVTRETLLGIEQWNANREFYAERYAALVDYIGDKWENDYDDCLKCKSPFGFSIRSQRL